MQKRHGMTMAEIKTEAERLKSRALVLKDQGLKNVQIAKRLGISEVTLSIWFSEMRGKNKKENVT